MNSDTLFAQITTGLKKTLAPNIGANAMLAVTPSNLGRGYSITGQDGKSTLFSRYSVHVIVLRDKMTGTAVFTDYGVKPQARSTTTRKSVDFTNLTNLIGEISQFLLTGTHS